MLTCAKVYFWNSNPSEIVSCTSHQFSKVRTHRLYTDNNRPSERCQSEQILHRKIIHLFFDQVFPIFLHIFESHQNPDQDEWSRRSFWWKMKRAYLTRMFRHGIRWKLRVSHSSTAICNVSGFQSEFVTLYYFVWSFWRINSHRHWQPLSFGHY